MICPKGTINVKRLARITNRVGFRSKRTMNMEPLVALPMRISASTDAAKNATTPGVHGGSRRHPKVNNNEENQITVAPCSLGSSLIFVLPLGTELEL